MAAELERRVREMDEGKVEGIPAEKVFADLRLHLEEVRRNPPPRLPPEIVARVLKLPPKERLALADELERILSEEDAAGGDA